jgi:S1-C subfamily serine protease
MKNRKKILICSIVLSMVMLFNSFNYTSTYCEETVKKLSDISTHWGKDYIEDLVEKGIVSGYPDGTFKPNENISRAAFITMLVDCLKLYKIEDETFTDTKNHWSNKNIGAAIEAKIILPEEYYDNKFLPNQNITRAEMARMITRALNKEQLVKSSGNRVLPFTDKEDILPSFKVYIYVASDIGIITGYSDGSFKPNVSATRAHAAKMITKMLEQLEDSKDDSSDLSAEEIFSKLKTSVVTVITSDDEGNEIGMGSGFIIDNNRVVTNYHVIKNSRSVKIRLFNKKEIEVVDIYDYDRALDLAILNIKGANSKGVELGDSSKVLTGQKIYTIGAPQGFEFSISDGVISNKNSTVLGNDYIQISAPISLGNSGGPLINRYGEVIGINTLIRIDAQNLNFSIPINSIKNMISGKDNCLDISKVTGDIDLINIGSKVQNFEVYQTNFKDEKDSRIYNDNNEFDMNNSSLYFGFNIDLEHYKELNDNYGVLGAYIYNKKGETVDSEVFQLKLDRDGITNVSHVIKNFSIASLYEGEYELKILLDNNILCTKKINVLNSFKINDLDITKQEFSIINFDDYTKDASINVSYKFNKDKTYKIGVRSLFEFTDKIKYEKWIKFDLTLYYPNGKHISYNSYKIIYPGESSLDYIDGIGYESYGQWLTGEYRYVVKANGEIIGDKTFTVY